jgi:hypothetical protein
MSDLGSAAVAATVSTSKVMTKNDATRKRKRDSHTLSPEENPVREERAREKAAEVVHYCFLL